MPFSWAQFAINILLAVGLFAAGMGFHMASQRLDELEARMTTFETVRIEYVAPAGDSG